MSIVVSFRAGRRPLLQLILLAALALGRTGRADGAERPCAVFRDPLPHPGQVAYSTVAHPGWRRLVPPAASPRAAAPQATLRAPEAHITRVAFPVVLPGEQRLRDIDRCQILADELQREKNALAIDTAHRADQSTLARHAADVAALLRELRRTGKSVSSRGCIP